LPNATNICLVGKAQATASFDQIIDISFAQVSYSKMSRAGGHRKVTWATHLCGALT
jgi:hypothetical protein